MTVVLDGRRLDVSARLGDANREPGVEIGGWLFARKGSATDEQHYLRLGFDGEAGHAKLWPAFAEEAEWDVSLPFDDWPEDETDSGDILAITVSLGNDGGPAQVLTLGPLVVSGGALPGEAVAWHVVGTGDGATDTFETRHPYVPGSLQVRVDRQDVPSAGIAGKDGPGRSFTLSDPPYGDPSDPDGSAVVEARYTRA